LTCRFLERGDEQWVKELGRRIKRYKGGSENLPAVETYLPSATGKQIWKLVICQAPGRA